MPTPSPRRIRYTLTALGAVGLIGAGSAAIIAGSGSDEQEVRVAATALSGARTADDAGTADAPPAAEPATSASASTSPATSPSAVPSASAGASASASAGASASASASASAKATAARRPRSRPAPSATSSRSTAPAPEPTRSTQAPSGGGSGSTGSSSVAGEVIRLVNIERQEAGCSALTSESRLEAAAQKHSELQAEQNSMSHQLPGEPSMGDRVTAQGYRWRNLGENVAAGYADAASVMDGWMNSPGHKANILNCAFQEIGVGLAKSSSGTRYWTQNFAAPA